MLKAMSAAPRWLYLVGLLLILMVTVYTCGVRAGSKPHISTSTTRATPFPPAGVMVAKSVANYQGYPLSRPSWCIAGTWGMASVVTPSSRTLTLVPTCLGADSSLTLTGIWTMPGCMMFKPDGGSTKLNSVILAPNGKPDLRYFSICKP